MQYAVALYSTIDRPHTMHWHCHMYSALEQCTGTGTGSALYLHLNPSSSAAFSYPHCSTLETTILYYSDGDDDAPDVPDGDDDDRDKK